MMNKETKEKMKEASDILDLIIEKKNNGFTVQELYRLENYFLKYEVKYSDNTKFKGFK